MRLLSVRRRWQAEAAGVRGLELVMLEAILALAQSMPSPVVNVINGDGWGHAEVGSTSPRSSAPMSPVSPARAARRP